jgi:hypothetical protein
VTESQREGVENSLAESLVNQDDFPAVKQDKYYEEWLRLSNIRSKDEPPSGRV